MKRTHSLVLVVATGSSRCRVLFLLTTIVSVVLAGQAFAQDLPSGGWMGSQTIGPSPEGNATAVQEGVYEVTGSGAAIWGTNDEIHYLFKELLGDGAMTCRVVDSGTGWNNWSKGGVMIRDTLDPGSAHCSMFLTGGGGDGAGMQWRRSTNALTEWIAGSAFPPYWIRIERTGSHFSCFLSEDSENWVQLGTQAVPMTDSVLIGLCVCSHAGQQLRTWTFDNVSFEGNVTGEIKGTAKDPSPEHDSEDVPYDTQLSWSPGDFAVTHNVYLGSSWNDVNDAGVDNPMGVQVSEGQTATYVDLDAPLDFGQVYYWRVDEVNAPPDSTVFKGDIWSFEAEPLSYVLPVGVVAATASSTDTQGDPNNIVNGVGLSDNGGHSNLRKDMWLADSADANPAIQFEFTKLQALDKLRVWNHNTQTEAVLGLGIKEALIETSTDGETWIELGTFALAQASGMADYTGIDVPLGGVMAQFVRITGLSNHSILGLPQMGLSEVRFYAIPLYARDPLPADGSMTDGVSVTLQWRSGREAVEHEVHFSDDLQTVLNGSAMIAAVDAPMIDAGTLDLGAQYFWKINEVNDAETPATYTGDIWTFLTPNARMIDDFEIYRAQEGLMIWQHWIDGYSDPNENGSLVGNGDEAEWSVVYEGRQSMPLIFNNTTAPKSEVTRFFDAALDLTKGNPESLKLQVRGEANNDAAPIYLRLADTSGKEVTIDHPDPDATAMQTWDEWTILLGDLAGIDVTKINSIALGVSRSTTGQADGKGILYIDAIRTHR